jgi:YfiH family protein
LTHRNTFFYVATVIWMLDTAALVPHWRPAEPHPDAVLAFSTRRGGVSLAPYDTLNLGRSTADRPEAVAENRRRILTAVALDPDRVATAGQVHGARVTEAAAPTLHPDTDALRSRARGLALAVTCADCLPILLVAPGTVAAVHCGWRGAAAGIAAAAARALDPKGGVARGTGAILGPCIRACCYVVGPEVAGLFPDCVETRADGTLHLDLPAAARRQLVASGVEPEAIVEIPECTSCRSDWYFSHRRDRGATGRHWAIAALRS